MSQTEPPSAETSPARRVFRAAWRYREPLAWATLVAIMVVVQWPMLKGLYYRTTGAAAPSSPIVWRTDVDIALAEARLSGKLVLVDFTASWCPPCIAMKHDVWPDRGVASAISAGFVAVMVDVDLDTTWSGRYDVPSIPALIVLNPDGRVLRRHDGFLPKSGMLRFLAGNDR